MTPDDARRLSRRRFIGALGASAGAVALDPASGGSSAGHPPRARASSPASADHFGRLFRLPSFAPPSPKVEAALRELGKPGGLLDAADPLAAGPKALIVDLSLSANIPTGTTFFGQYLDHDKPEPDRITFDATSRLARATAPAAARNFRTPALDLDSVYGSGPPARGSAAAVAASANSTSATRPRRARTPTRRRGTAALAAVACRP
jgi:hypothetical protein